MRVTYFQVVVLGMVHDNLVPETSCKMVVSFGWQNQFIKLHVKLVFHQTSMEKDGCLGDQEWILIGSN